VKHPSLPGPGTVHVWQASLAVDDARLDALREHLSPEEDARGARLLDPLAKRRFWAGRGILRSILASYLSADPADIRFGTGPSGKPFLQAEPPPRVPSLSRGGTGWGWVSSHLSFNLSHSHDLLVLAVTPGDEIGVDVEVMRDDLDFAPLARTCFSAAEQETLFGLPAELQRVAFYRCWTRKEAYLKGTGSGFSRSSTLFDVTLRSGDEAALVEHREFPADVINWRLYDLDVLSGYCASLAVMATLTHPHPVPPLEREGTCGYLHLEGQTAQVPILEYLKWS